MFASSVLAVWSLVFATTHPYVRIDPKLDSSWKQSVDRRGAGEWSLNIWHNDKGEEIALVLGPKLKFESEEEASKIIAFVTSSNPSWIDDQRFPALRDRGISKPRFLKISTETYQFETRGSTKLSAPALSFVMVSENAETPFMAVGTAVSIRGTTFLIQHNSTRPISDKLVTDTLSSVFDWARVRRVDLESSERTP